MLAAAGRAQLRLRCRRRLGLALVALLPVAQLPRRQALVFRGDAVLGLLYGLGAMLASTPVACGPRKPGATPALRWLGRPRCSGAIAAFAVAFSQWLHVASGGWCVDGADPERGRSRNLAQPNHLALLHGLGHRRGDGAVRVAPHRARASLALVVLVFALGIADRQSRSALVAIVLVGCAVVRDRGRVGSRLRRLRRRACRVRPRRAVLGRPGSMTCCYHVVAERSRSTFEVGPRDDLACFHAAIAEQPWFGYGFGPGRDGAQLATQVRTLAQHVHRSHNLVLDLVTWFGVPLALALCAAFAGGCSAGCGAARPGTAGRHLLLAIWPCCCTRWSSIPHSLPLLPAARGADDGCDQPVARRLSTNAARPRARRAGCRRSPAIAS